MHFDGLLTLGFLCSSAPFLVMGAILVHYQLRRAVWRRNLRKSRRLSGFCPSAAAMGMVLVFMQIVWRPSAANFFAAQQEEDADEDDAGDPESLAKQLNQQLKRIRRGESVERLVLRL
jgi:hypothetical protein